MDEKTLRIEFDELWEKYNDLLDEKKKLEARFEDLESQWSIIWRFWIGPLWEKFYELIEALDTNAKKPVEERTFVGEPPRIDPGRTLDEVKELYVNFELARLGGNKMKTARSLKINVKTLYNLLSKWEKERKERTPC